MLFFFNSLSSHTHMAQNAMARRGKTPSRRSHPRALSHRHHSTHARSCMDGSTFGVFCIWIFHTNSRSQRCFCSSTCTSRTSLLFCTAAWCPFVWVHLFSIHLVSPAAFALSLKMQRKIKIRQLCSLLLPREVSVPFPSYPSLFLSISFFLSLCLSHSYESSAEILPHTPRLTHFPTVSGSPASLADSMQQKLAGPRRRRPQNPSAM